MKRVQSSLLKLRSQQRRSNYINNSFRDCVLKEGRIAKDIRSKESTVHEGAGRRIYTRRCEWNEQKLCICNEIRDRPTSPKRNNNFASVIVTSNESLRVRQEVRELSDQGIAIRAGACGCVRGGRVLEVELEIVVHR